MRLKNILRPGFKEYISELMKFYAETAEIVYQRREVPARRILKESISGQELDNTLRAFTGQVFCSVGRDELFCFRKYDP